MFERAGEEHFVAGHCFEPARAGPKPTMTARDHLFKAFEQKVNALLAACRT